MAMVEGVGDEVVEFMVAVVLVAVAMLAWWSTNARPSRYRTVLVMRSRVHPVTVSIRTVSTSHPALPSEGSSSGRLIPVQEMDSIIDADMAMLNNQRLHFYRRIDAPNASPSMLEGLGAERGEDGEAAGGDPAGAAQIHEMESIVSAMEADAHVPDAHSTLVPESLATAPNGDIQSDQNDALSPSNQPEQNETRTEEPSSEVVNRSKILIKLKYLNDTLKEVEGCLDELLKDFKWRHFSTELSSARLVRLVFRGRVLPDASTLRDCGLHHRAVVHCLVHNQRGAGAAGAGTGAGEAGAGAGEGAPVLAEAAPPDRAWDLENILMTIVSVVLTVIWFFRCEYSNLFTASASVALFGLTVFYSVSIFGLYLSDAFPLDAQPAAARRRVHLDN